MAERAQISVKGTVQGVGFRPYVYSLATSLGLAGHVSNTADGVNIDIEGSSVADFIHRLPIEAPPLSRITDISITPLPFHGYAGFTIRTSSARDGSNAFTHISSDVSVCSDCLRELNDPNDRRYRYPFINCTNCGPRYTITLAVPYDRPNTTMADFSLCPECSREYHDPRDRRFHAQPIACPVCGPKCEFKISSLQFNTDKGDPVVAAITVLNKGGIVAIKGLGGFHIACDAMNHQAVVSLRERKRKSNKPFAVMAASVDVLREFCEVTREEQELLESPKRPIVLLKKKYPDAAFNALSDAVAPNNQYVGCMLPYTPLHSLLFSVADKNHAVEVKTLSVLVMTSGNLSEEPIVHKNVDSIGKLSGIVDAFLIHNRDIFMRVDDSVVRIVDFGLRNADHKERTNISLVRTPKYKISFLRRARGYAPEAIALQDNGPEVLGCGADLKNTFTLTKGSFAIPSQHIGDMENYETLKFYEECLANLKQVYRVEPVAIVHDLHPGYLSTRWALEEGTKRNLPLFPIQHHYAHIGSVMAEHGLTEKVIGVAFDGTGYGTDGNLWGGEFLIAGIDGFERMGQLKYVRLPGGEAAIREPWRTAVSIIVGLPEIVFAGTLERIGFMERYGREAIDTVIKLSRSSELSPLSSGAGRLFDAVSAILGICDRNTFEGEAAMALEARIEKGIEEEYVVEFNEENGYTVLDFAPVVAAIVGDMAGGRATGLIAAKFHNTIVSAIVATVRNLSGREGTKDVALSGGTFQNQYLLERTTSLLSRDGMWVHTNAQMPPNDACISLGQAYLIRERLKKGTAR
jgi:hydrogenase maturation protein HypF